MLILQWRETGRVPILQQSVSGRVPVLQQSVSGVTVRDPERSLSGGVVTETGPLNSKAAGR